ncbi:hypothetical protein [Burkholderia cepacia]|uniref:hypothetical protein n=1 Tax=Burkholderia cepacia TaxID=292 RepID=UPI003527FCAA
MKTEMQQIEAWKIDTLRLAGASLPLGASTQGLLWISAVRVMLKKLGLVDVLHHGGDVLHLTDAYQFKIKTHPGHSQNRGEKRYRVRLSQFLAALQ